MDEIWMNVTENAIQDICVMTELHDYKLFDHTRISILSYPD